MGLTLSLVQLQGAGQIGINTVYLSGNSPVGFIGLDIFRDKGKRKRIVFTQLFISLKNFSI
jgi:hypothetical protein